MDLEMIGFKIQNYEEGTWSGSDIPSRPGEVARYLHIHAMQGKKLVVASGYSRLE